MVRFPEWFIDDHRIHNRIVANHRIFFNDKFVGFNYKLFSASFSASLFFCLLLCDPFKYLYIHGKLIAALESSKEKGNDKKKTIKEMSLLLFLIIRKKTVVAYHWQYCKFHKFSSTKKGKWTTTKPNKNEGCVNFPSLFISGGACVSNTERR